MFRFLNICFSIYGIKQKNKTKRKRKRNLKKREVKMSCLSNDIWATAISFARFYLF